MNIVIHKKGFNIDTLVNGSMGNIMVRAHVIIMTPLSQLAGSYQGDWVDGRRQGRGLTRFTRPLVGSYDGEMEADSWKGQGTLFPLVCSLLPSGFLDVTRKNHQGDGLNFLHSGPKPRFTRSSHF